ncbi:MAG: hypothetical protein KatS3mg129_1496 [Leptospiraceae bacterium]|nr:MAG: hypothetical protein KatS3mg129_1496 [Leptospiraceae bacterium]
MNLKVIHLIRKIERIERDMEEIQTLLNTLQMDREYSKKLKDSLIEEYHRLKKLRSTILKQIVHIPPNFEDFINELFQNDKKIEQQIEIQTIFVSKSSKSKEKKTKSSPEENHNQKNNLEENNSSKISTEKKSSTQKTNKKSPFIFKIE